MSVIPGEALLNHTKDICKVTLLESVQETLHITTSRKPNNANGNQMAQKKLSNKTTENELQVHDDKPVNLPSFSSQCPVLARSSSDHLCEVPKHDQ